jgi:hypothetical protein
MESGTGTGTETGSGMSSTVFYIGTAIFIALIVGFIAYMLLSRMRTVPFAPSGADWAEGFQGPTNGVSAFSCGQESAAAVALVEMFYGRKSSTEEGSPDLVELKAILSKMCCMKHDLMSPSQVVQASLYLPYSNIHDRENPADTVGRCFTKGIPPRDLDITYKTWKDRGLLLINRLCTSYDMTTGESERAANYFMACWSDCFDVAKTVCLKASVPVVGSPRDPKGFTPESVKEHGTYTGYY